MHSMNQIKSTASIISVETGAVIGGQIIEKYADGRVTISFAGLKKVGMPLSTEDMVQIQAGTWKGDPLVREQRGE